MHRVVLLLVLIKSVYADEPVFYFRACKETQAYVEHLAHYMGIKGRIEVLINVDGTWGGDQKGAFCISVEADKIFCDKLLRASRSAALYRGLLMHELGHLRQKKQEQQGVLRTLYVKSSRAEQLRLSREEERAADAAVLDDRDVLGAMRDYFLKRSGVVSIKALEKLSDAEMSSQASVQSTHPCDAARARYFHQRLQELEQSKQDDAKDFLDMILMRDFC